MEKAVEINIYNTTWLEVKVVTLQLTQLNVDLINNTRAGLLKVQDMRPSQVIEYY